MQKKEKIKRLNSQGVNSEEKLKQIAESAKKQVLNIKIYYNITKECKIFILFNKFVYRFYFFNFFLFIYIFFQWNLRIFLFFIGKMLKI